MFYELIFVVFPITSVMPSDPQIIIMSITTAVQFTCFSIILVDNNPMDVTDYPVSYLFFIIAKLKVNL